MSVPAIFGASPSPYWYLTRGAGTVSLILLTATLVLGIVEVNRWRSERWPRFLVDGLHRNLSLLALLFLAIHILTSVLDSFAPIALKDAVLPFTSSYRPLWLGLGALTLDILLAVVLTSMVRRRLGYGAWRAVHWAAYATWPLAVVHGLGTGTDAPQPWLLAITFLCLVAVVSAIAWRISSGWPSHRSVRTAAAWTLAIAPVGLITFLLVGPLASNWSARSGTPASLLAAVRPAPVTQAGARLNGSENVASSDLSFPLAASLHGTITQGAVSAAGLVEIDLKMKMSSGAKGTLDIGLVGQPTADGGVAMSESAVAMGTAVQPKLYGGQINSLSGSRIRASVSNAAGETVALSVNLSIDQVTQTVTGTVQSSGSPSAKTAEG